MTKISIFVQCMSIDVIDFECQAGTKMVSKNTICYRLSNDLWNIQEEPQLPEMEIITPPETLTLPDKEPGVKVCNLSPFANGTWISCLL